MAEKRTPQRFQMYDGAGFFTWVEDALFVRVHSRRETEWEVDRRWDAHIHRSRKQRTVVHTEPEYLLDAYEEFPHLFVLPTGCPPELMPHAELRKHIARRKLIAVFFTFFASQLDKDRKAWLSYVDTEAAYQRWVEREWHTYEEFEGYEPPDFCPDLLAEAVRGWRIYRNVDPVRGPGFKRLTLLK